VRDNQNVSDSSWHYIYFLQESKQNFVVSYDDRFILEKQFSILNDHYVLRIVNNVSKV